MAPQLISRLLAAYCSTVSLLLSFPPLCSAIAPRGLPALTLRQDNTFTIALFPDLHYGEEEDSWGIDQDVNSTRATSAILSHERPDLAVLLGDLITGENTFAYNASAYVHRVVAPLASASVPWASVYGNHDSSATLRREDMLDVERGYELSYTTTTAGLEGVTNYYLLVYRHGRWGGKEEKGDRPVAVLWFFDSRGGMGRYGEDNSSGGDIPNWVGPETARWFTREARALRERFGGVLPGLAFVHIPPRAFLTAQRKGIDPALFPGVNDDVPVAVQGTGKEDVEFMDALREEWKVGGLHSVYVGHDHGNAWCALWPEQGDEAAGGPFLCFGKHTGYGGYGNWNRGARYVQLKVPNRCTRRDSKVQVETWVRMESGEIVTRVRLNGTYGSDRYPVENGEQ
jgi:hypothetical protein